MKAVFDQLISTVGTFFFLEELNVGYHVWCGPSHEGDGLVYKVVITTDMWSYLDLPDDLSQKLWSYLRDRGWAMHSVEVKIQPQP